MYFMRYNFSALLATLILISWGEMAVLAQEAIDPTEGITIDFELVDHEGKVVRASDYLGNYVLLGFGFTNCAHICPMMAANMGRVLKSTDKDALGIFISVDTERDTPADTHAYASNYNERMLGLGGDYSQVAKAAKNFKVTYAVTKSPNNYTVQHTSNTYLIGPDGDLLGIYALNTPVAEILSEIERR
jgi:cytochrome oxidase Cu insertion factor (SCO1/SenC/PrrC family)